MAMVQLISGRRVEAQLTNIEYVGDEGGRRAIAHVEGQTYYVYKSNIAGFDIVWYEQLDFEAWKAMRKAGFVEGSIEELGQ